MHDPEYLSESGDVYRTARRLGVRFVLNDSEREAAGRNIQIQVQLDSSSGCVAAPLCVLMGEPVHASVVYSTGIWIEEGDYQVHWNLPLCDAPDHNARIAELVRAEGRHADFRYRAIGSCSLSATIFAPQSPYGWTVFSPSYEVREPAELLIGYSAGIFQDEPFPGSPASLVFAQLPWQDSSYQGALVATARTRAEETMFRNSEARIVLPDALAEAFATFRTEYTLSVLANIRDSQRSIAREELSSFFASQGVYLAHQLVRYLSSRRYSELDSTASPIAWVENRLTSAFVSHEAMRQSRLPLLAFAWRLSRISTATTDATPLFSHDPRFLDRSLLAPDLQSGVERAIAVGREALSRGVFSEPRTSGAILRFRIGDEVSSPVRVPLSSAITVVDRSSIASETSYFWGGPDPGLIRQHLLIEPRFLSSILGLRGGIGVAIPIAAQPVRFSISTGILVDPIAAFYRISSFRNMSVFSRALSRISGIFFVDFSWDGINPMVQVGERVTVKVSDSVAVGIHGGFSFMSHDVSPSFIGAVVGISR